MKPGASRARMALRAMSALGGAALLSACAGHGPAAQGPVLTATQEAAVYRAHARNNYQPPGPPDDPWGPYIIEASHRFDVPDTWIREVIRVESGGYQFRASGELTTSPVGAMGLMQLMPETYDEMRAQYGLGDDAYDPHNNILAGSAYMRQMYDAFGSPGFLAAYNAGPARLQDYLTKNRPLPDETRRYVWMIGSRIGGVYPQSRSPAEQLAVNQIPVNIPAGPRWVRHVVLASRGRHRHQAGVAYAALDRRHRHAVAASAPVEVAEAPEPRAGRVQVAQAATTSHHGGGLHIIDSAMANENARPGGWSGRDWAVQIGAYGSRGQAQAAAGAARVHVGGANTAVAAVGNGHVKLYRARVAGLTHDAAVAACQRLAHHGGGCMVVSPASAR